MTFPDRSACWRLSRLLLTIVLLEACATSPHRSGAAPRGDLRLDTESVARARYAGLTHSTAGAATTATTATSLVVGATTLVLATPLVMAVLRHDEEKAAELQERLVECARQAEQQVNFPLFGNRPPTRAECGEELEVDGCVRPITRAMHLGQQKHALALACIRDVLAQLWPAPFSIEQRYRFYRHAQVLETISYEEEQRFIKQGCTKELWSSIKPDIVLHSDYNLLQAALTIDLKFPCPPSNPPQWTNYGRGSAYENLNQGEVYKKALGGEVLLLTPRRLIR
jgi:hypothetical protein